MTQGFCQVLGSIAGRLECVPKNRQKTTDSRRGAFIAPNKLPMRLAGAVIAFGLLAGISASSIAGAQDLSTGALNVTVVDPSDAVVNGAQLVLKDLETNDVHTAATRGAGNAVLSF